MSTFRLQIVTPDGLFFDGEVERVVVRSTEGDVAVMKNHIDYVTPLGIGETRLTLPETKRTAATAGGFLHASRELTRIVASTFEWADEIDVQRAEHARDQAQQRMEQELGDQESRIAEMKLRRALNRLRVAER